ncbi:MAG TPA: hypothetical protein VH089_24165 [Streptosporangiaceae bacterium]|nr:hypothetical protein [Streptosporangiaceae bacterium]
MTERDTGPDPLGDLQRWLMRTGARSVTKEMTGSVRRALGQDRPAADVWDTATNRPEDEAPECAWCPVCRAARRMRERQGAGASSGLGSTLTGASDALASVVQEAYSAFESAMKAPPSKPSASRPSSRWEDAGRDPDDRR